jgi:hypothetical protein
MDFKEPIETPEWILSALLKCLVNFVAGGGGGREEGYGGERRRDDGYGDRGGGMERGYLRDGESSLGDATSSLGTLTARWVTLRARWGR